MLYEGIVMSSPIGSNMLSGRKVKKKCKELEVFLKEPSMLITETSRFGWRFVFKSPYAVNI